MKGFDPEAVTAIRARLDLARQTGVKILFAIESGSRAWGFPSPDSDYDCRFVYLWPADEHLVLQAQRDVIEFPIEGDIDAGGWDLRKALQLALKGNAAIVEWVNSPLTYEEFPGFRVALKALFEEIMHVPLVARHYLGLLRRHTPEEHSEMKLKKLFYALRPALSLQYMEEHDFAVLPPMHLTALLDGVTLGSDLRALIEQMVELKKITREMGTGHAPDVLLSYIAKCRTRCKQKADRLASLAPSEVAARYRIAQNFYRDAVIKASAV